MKKTIIALAVMMGFNTAIKAQNLQTAPAAGTTQQSQAPQTPEERAKRSANHAEKKLGLTAQQKSDWEVAALKRNMANQPFHDQLKAATTPEQRKEIHGQMKVNNQAFESTVNGFLTADQKTKFTAMKEERKQHAMKGSNKKFEESDVNYGE
jgi:hypothetical protein